MSERLIKLLDELIIQGLIDNRTAIMFGVAGFIYALIEYKLGESNHGSFIGFLKTYFKRDKNDDLK